MASKYALYSHVLFQRASVNGKGRIALPYRQSVFPECKPIGAGQRITQNDKPVVIVVFQPVQTAADKLVLPGGNVFFFQCRRQRPEWEKNGSGILCNFVPPAGHGVVISVYDMPHGCNARPPANVVQKARTQRLFLYSACCSARQCSLRRGPAFAGGFGGRGVSGRFLFCRRLWYNKARSITSYARPAKRAACRATPKGGPFYGTHHCRAGNAAGRGRACCGAHFGREGLRGGGRRVPAHGKGPQPCKGKGLHAMLGFFEEGGRVRRGGGPVFPRAQKAIPARMW